jgi:serine/threonine protein kinase
MSLDRVARVFEHRSFRERYDVLDRIGSGSFAQVYRAVQRSTGQDVAVKILTLDDRPDADPIQLEIARFRREVQLCAYLRHPKIVRLMDSGQPSSEIIYAISSTFRGGTWPTSWPSRARSPRHRRCT